MLAKIIMYSSQLGKYISWDDLMTVTGLFRLWASPDVSASRLHVRWALAVFSSALDQPWGGGGCQHPSDNSCQSLGFLLDLMMDYKMFICCCVDNVLSSRSRLRPQRDTRLSRWSWNLWLFTRICAFRWIQSVLFAPKRIFKQNRNNISVATAPPNQGA